MVRIELTRMSGEIFDHFFLRCFAIGEELLVPTKIYTSAVMPLLREGNVKAIAHITGNSMKPKIVKKLLTNFCRFSEPKVVDF